MPAANAAGISVQLPINPQMTLLAVDNLTVSFPTADGVVHAVRGLSFSVDTGKTVCSTDEPVLTSGADDPATHLTACHFPVAPGEKLASEKATILHAVEGFLAEAST